MRCLHHTSLLQGVMLSHDACTWAAAVSAESLRITHEDDCIVSYLPLSHAFAQLTDIWVAMRCGAAVYFADRGALKGPELGKIIVLDL